MKIGILVPLSQELKSLTQEKIPVGNFRNISENILVYRTGVGKANTARAIQQLLKFGANHLISWGTAAGLSSTVFAGDLLLPDAVLTPDNHFHTNHEITSELLKLMPTKVKVHSGSLAYTKDLLRSIGSKQELFAKTRSLGADMESGALAEIADGHGIPFSVIRSVSDPVTMKLPKAVLAGLSTSASGDFNRTRFVKQGMVNPADWGLIIKLGLNFKKAQKTLHIVAHLLKDLRWT